MCGGGGRRRVECILVNDIVQLLFLFNFGRCTFHAMLSSAR